jgi:hypothetical protein
MAKKKNIKPNDELHTVHEPFGTYEPNRIQFFKSFEEMKEADITSYIMYAYSKELKSSENDLKIHFK